MPIMNREELARLASRYHLLPDDMGTTNLVRRIQLVQGHKVCFATVDALSCGKGDCPWRSDCRQRFLGGGDD